MGSPFLFCSSCSSFSCSQFISFFISLSRSVVLSLDTTDDSRCVSAPRKNEKQKCLLECFPVKSRLGCGFPDNFCGAFCRVSHGPRRVRARKLAPTSSKRSAPDARRSTCHRSLPSFAIADATKLRSRQWSVLATVYVSSSRAKCPAILCFCTRNVFTGEVLCCFMHWCPILCIRIQKEPMSSVAPLKPGEILASS